MAATSAAATSHLPPPDNGDLDQLRKKISDAESAEKLARDAWTKAQKVLDKLGKDPLTEEETPAKREAVRAQKEDDVRKALAYLDKTTERYV